MKRRKAALRAPAAPDDLLADVIKEFAAMPTREAREDHYTALTISSAELGNHLAGIEVLRLCAEALDVGRRSFELSAYLRRAIGEIEKGLPRNTTADQISVLAARALRLSPKRKQGKPRIDFPDWEEPLGAFAAILKLRGYRPEDILDAMDKARMALENRPLGRTEAQRIRKNYAPLLKKTGQRYGDDGQLRLLTPEERDDDLMRMALLADGRPRRNAKILQVLLGKYPRMR